MAVEVQDVRHFVFGLYLADNPDKLPPGAPIRLVKEQFLGTAFFVTRNGIALAANHCMPKPEAVPEDRAVLAALWRGGKPAWHRVVADANPTSTDLAILKVSSVPSPYLQIDWSQMSIGDDVTAVGIPGHLENEGNIDMRCLKGHILEATRKTRAARLSFEVPRGMSGSPLFKSGLATGVLLGTGRSEFLDDSYVDEQEKAGEVTRVTRTEVKRVIHYGAAEHLWRLADWHHEITGGEPLQKFIAKINERKPGSA